MLRKTHLRNLEELPLWQMSDADPEIYAAQKSILLPLDDSESLTNAPGIPESVWESVYLPRLNAHLNKVVVAPQLFPGAPPFIAHMMSPANFAFERHQAFKQSEFLNSDTRHKYLPASTVDGLSKIETNEHLNDAFQSIRSAWGIQMEGNYVEDAITIALKYIRMSGKADTATLMELEDYASYQTLLSKLTCTMNGFYHGKWIDVGLQKLSNFRATEDCQPARLIQELENLSAGRVAPLVVNEYGCISDGNHRVCAAWIWNMLHMCANVDWQITNPELKHILTTYIKSQINDTNLFAIRTASKKLSALLTDAQFRPTLMRLHSQIMSQKVESLPVVPMLVYNNFALARELSEQQGKPVRFDPRIYLFLMKNCESFLSPRACFHYADRVRMPWFSVLTPSSAKDTATTITTNAQSLHRVSRARSVQSFRAINNFRDMHDFQDMHNSSLIDAAAWKLCTT